MLPKYKTNIQAFIMGKDGSLYYGTHEGYYDPVKPTLTHASFLGGKPAEMAGMISINQEGKINLFSSDSGHYTPEPLDMYRGIKKLQELMPGVVTPDCKITYYDNNIMHNMLLNKFMQMMEKPGIHGTPLHQELRDNRIKETKQYKENLKNAISIQINSTSNDLPTILAGLTKKDKEELATALNRPMVGISTIDSTGGRKPETYNISDVAIFVINSGKSDAMQTLLDVGITKNKEFETINPLYYAVLLNENDIVKTMLGDNDIRKSLMKNTDLRSSILHMSIEDGNSEIVKEMLKYPEGHELLTMQDQYNNTPLQTADYYDHHDIADILKSAIAQDQLVHNTNEEKFEQIIRDGNVAKELNNLKENQFSKSISSTKTTINNKRPPEHTR